MAPKWASPPHCSEAAHLKMKCPSDRVCIARGVGIPPAACPITQKCWSSTKSTACQALKTTPEKKKKCTVHQQLHRSLPHHVHSEGRQVGNCGAKWMSFWGPRVFSRGSYTVSLLLPMMLNFSVSLLPLLPSFAISFQGQALSRWV